jgi:hypothetical protein
MFMSLLHSISHPMSLAATVDTQSTNTESYLILEYKYLTFEAVYKHKQVSINAKNLTIKLSYQNSKFFTFQKKGNSKGKGINNFRLAFEQPQLHFNQQFQAYWTKLSYKGRI